MFIVAVYSSRQVAAGEPANMIRGENFMREVHRSDSSCRRHYTPAKENALTFNARMLYAGHLERSRHWTENLHSHDFCEVIFIVSGAGVADIGNESYNVSEGDILIYNAGVLHKERSEDVAPLEMFFFACTGLQLNDFPDDCLLPENATPVIHTSGDRKRRFETCFHSLVTETQTEMPYSEIMAEYWTKLILTGILRQTNVTERKLVKNMTFSRIYSYLTENFAKISSIDDVCKDLYINQCYLTHVFKKYMGIPPQQYVIKCRMTLAKKLLEETDLSVAAISEQCGYFDQNRFFKTFKKSEGVTPLSYRKHGSAAKRENIAQINPEITERSSVSSE